MKSVLGWTAHLLMLGMILAAIWLPAGHRWQWIATAVILFFIGAMLLGSRETRAPAPRPAVEDEDDTSVDFHEIYRTDRPTYGRKRNEGER